MPWKEQSVFEARREAVALYLSGASSKAAVAELYDVSRPTLDRWLARYDAEAPGWAQDRPSTPHTCPRATPADVAAAACAVRQAHPRWGARKVRAYLARTVPDVDWPAPSTLTRLLAAAGLVAPRRRRPRGRAQPTGALTPPTAPNTVWTLDFKGWFRLGGGGRCEPITLLDAYSRLLLACEAAQQPDTAQVQALCWRLFQTYGLPEVLRTDNGGPFASTGRAGLTRLSVWWLKLGIRPERIAPGHPEQNGAHERFHGVLAADVPVAATLGEQQALFEAYRTEYNTVRPHEALGYQVPAALYTPSPRPCPATVPPVGYPPGVTTRHVRPDGLIRWDGALVYVSAALAGEDVALHPRDDRFWDVTFLTVPLGILDRVTHRWVTPARRATM